MTRAALATALFGLALALVVPALHLDAASTGTLLGRYWPVVLLGAGLGGLLSPRRFYGAATPTALVLLGAALLAGRISGFPLLPLLLAALLLALAVRLVLRPALGRKPGLAAWPRMHVAGEVHLGGPDFRAENSSTYLWVGQLYLDLSQTRLPAGTTPLSIGMFAGEVEIALPAEVGVRASGSLLAGEIDILGHAAEGITPHLRLESEDYAQHQRRLNIDVRMWFGEVRIRRGG